MQKKASEGVKIFVIVYRNIGAAIPIDSAYTKYSLLDLHPNVFVQRSPNQIRQNTFFWAHHEKILVVDHMVAFVGGIDLCFGRWDTPQHSLRDDRPTGFEDNSPNKDPDNFQLWPGKDYSNPKVQDFFSLDKPYEEMYDRARVPRMPWHDISMQLVGQPARDLTRHFVQRWNYLLRQRKPSRPTPVLLPPPDFTDEELQSLGIDGTCEIQILRSSCAWSMGTPYVVERSIMNAYLKAIETSEHFVYIENQFFITSCEWEGTKIENSIGDALVERIIRANKHDEDWRAIIVIPLMPGFQSSVDVQDGTSIRLIMQCQYRSMCRGDSSIFGRLRAQGIDPEDFIQFYGLRNWGKIGPEDALVTEQLYIHAKCMVVDDRIVIIGSANINERSMLGNRDSEVAAIVRDTDTVMSTMAGKPYRVGKFAHSLRLRLMREHLGMDVDGIMAEERKQEMEAWEKEMSQWSERVGGEGESPTEPIIHMDGEGMDSDIGDGETPTVSRFAGLHTRASSVAVGKKEEAVLRSEALLSFNHDVDWEQENSPHLKTRKWETADSRVTENPKHREDVEGDGTDNMRKKEDEKMKRRDKAKAYLRRAQGDGKKKDKGKQRESAGFTRNSLPPWETRSLSRTPFSNEASSPPSTSGGQSISATISAAISGRRSRADTTTTTSSSVATNTTSETTGYDGLPPSRANTVQDPNIVLPPLPKTSDFDIGGPPQLHRQSSTAGNFLSDMVIPRVEPDMFTDPLADTFYLDIWHACAVNNTKIFREVFRCMPDNEVKTWKEYKEYTAYQEKFAASMFPADKGKGAGGRKQDMGKGGQNPPGTASSNGGGGTVFSSIGETLNDQGSHLSVPGNQGGGEGSAGGSAGGSIREGDEGETPSSPTLTAGGPQTNWGSWNARENLSPSFGENQKPGTPRSANISNYNPPPSRGTMESSTNTNRTNNDGRPFSSSTTTTFNGNSGNNNNAGGSGSGQPTTLHVQPSVRRRRRNTRSSRRGFHATDEMISKEAAEVLLEKVQGHLVVWPYDWLAKAEEQGNWGYGIDQLAPIEI